MSTLREVFNSHNVQLLDLPMNEDKFIAALKQVGLFPGNSLAKVKAQPTEAEAAQYFLDNIIDKAWMYDNSNPLLDELLTVMKKWYDPAIQSLAYQIETGNAEGIVYIIRLWGTVNACIYKLCNTCML